ncbi:MAG: preprotein translocase subunit SecE [Rhabdochlamydiaceae bacterium]|nr:preprotein translocase subunit SecE [Candidatus Amphrikana amoebophyrae]
MAQRITPMNHVKANSRKSGPNFVSGIKEEMKKVTWTEKKELQHCTKMVLGTTFFFGLGIYIVDLMIKGVLDSLGIVGKWIAQ